MSLSIASSLLRLHQKMTEVFHVLGPLLCLMMLALQRSDAYEFKAGGGSGWSVPSDSSTNTFNQWAEHNRFQIGDSLVFDYPPGQDSVLYVKQDDYNNCNNGSPMAKYVDGHTVFKFNHSGPFYFISGNKDNCLKNEKLVVVVMADRSNKTSGTSSPPSPAPSSEESPSPPTTGTVEINPSPAPTEQSPPPGKASGASPVLVSFTSSIRVLMASSLLLAL